MVTAGATRDRWLVWSWVAAPLAALANQAASYFLAESAHGQRTLHALSAVALVIALSGLLAARRTGDVAREEERSTFMARAGLLLSALSILLIAAHEMIKIYAPWSPP